MKYKQWCNVGICFKTIVTSKLMESNAFGDGEKGLYLEDEICGLPDQNQGKASDTHIDFNSHCFIGKTARFR